MKYKGIKVKDMNLEERDAYRKSIWRGPCKAGKKRYAK